MANEKTPLQRWSEQTNRPSTPEERVLALLNSPLGSSAWANPLREGPFTVQHFWDARSDMSLRYRKTWPNDPMQLAQVLLDIGLEKTQIDTALRIEQQHDRQSLTDALQMHRHLRKSHGMSTTCKDALDALTTVFEASVGLDLGKGTVEAALRSQAHSYEKWSIALNSLMQYDNSMAAQTMYFESIKKALLVEKEKPAAGALPERGRRRMHDVDATYVYGWDSTGSALVQTLPDVDNKALAAFLHSKHDLHGLGAMVAQQRLDFATFLDYASKPSSSTPMPEVVNRYGENRTPLESHHEKVVEVTSALVDMLPANMLKTQTALAVADNPSLADTLHAFVQAPKETSSIASWWEWNTCLNTMGLTNPREPNAQMRQHLDQLQAVTPTGIRSYDSSLKYMKPQEFDAGFEALASAHPVLANTALAMLLNSVPRHSKPTEVWDALKGIYTGWLGLADCSRLMNSTLLESSSYSGTSHILPFAAMMLPHMSALDQAKIAPLVAYGVGVRNVASLSPSTLRNMWKEHDPDAFKASIPRQYTGDTYILYALTRKNADELMKTLSAMDVRHDIPAYLECVETWTRQAMDLPPLIEDIGPTENLFGV